MARRIYTVEERETLLRHYLEKCGLHYEGEDPSDCPAYGEAFHAGACEFPRLVDSTNRPAYGSAFVRVFREETAELRYSLPLPQSALYRAELLEQINLLNATYHRNLTLYLCKGNPVWTLCIESSIPYRGCSRQQAKRAASEILWRLGIVHVCVERLTDMLPDYLTDASLREAHAAAVQVCEPCEEDFADPMDYVDALLEHYYSDAEPAPSFAMPSENPDAAPNPEWPEEWGDEEAFLAENEPKDLYELSGSELIKMHVALSRALNRKKQQLNELLEKNHQQNSDNT